MKRIALLIQATPCLEDGNYLRFAPHLAQKGCEVDLFLVDSIRMQRDRIVADGFPWEDHLKDGDAFPPCSTSRLDHDLIWLLGLGERTNFLDKYQLLYALEQHSKICNSLEAIMHLKSKYFLAVSEFQTPETYAASSASELTNIVMQNGGNWIVKPPAGSLGRDVFKVSADDSNLVPILQNLCGPDDNQYTLLQRYVPEIESGEKRILLAGGQIIGQYLRESTGDHRTNVSQGASISACELSSEETKLCERLAKELLKRGAYFAGVDLAYPWLIEVNVINPGGITTIETLTDTDLSKAAIDAILSVMP